MAGGAKRQSLPPLLPSCLKAVDPLKGGGADVADTKGPGQGGDVQEEAGAAVIGRE